jgi:hypothetical protein
MQLVTIANFRDVYFGKGSAPPRVTVRRWCEANNLPARKIGGIWYIDADAFERDDDDVLFDKVMNA